MTSRNRVPILVAHAHEQAILGDPGIVDENIDAAELAFSLFAERLHGSAVGKVCREQVDALTERIGQLLQLFDARAVQADNRALGMQDAGNLFANAAGCTGNEGLAARKDRTWLFFLFLGRERMGGSE